MALYCHLSTSEAAYRTILPIFRYGGPKPLDLKFMRILGLMAVYAATSWVVKKRSMANLLLETLKAMNTH